MKNKSLSILIAVIVSINNFSICQTTTYQQVDPKAKSILDKVSAKTKEYKTIQADFGIIVENKQ